MSLIRTLYRVARASAVARAFERSLETGSLRPVQRRLTNKVVRRAVSRTGVWGALWN